MYILKTINTLTEKRVDFAVNENYELLSWEDYSKNNHSFSPDLKLDAFQEISAFSAIYMNTFYHIAPEHMIDEDLLYKNGKSKYFVIEERNGCLAIWFTLRPISFEVFEE